MLCRFPCRGVLPKPPLHKCQRPLRLYARWLCRLAGNPRLRRNAYVGAASTQRSVSRGAGFGVVQWLGVNDGPPQSTCSMTMSSVTVGLSTNEDKSQAMPAQMDSATKPMGSQKLREIGRLGFGADDPVAGDFLAQVFGKDFTDTTVSCFRSERERATMFRAKYLRQKILRPRSRRETEPRQFVPGFGSIRSGFRSTAAASFFVRKGL